MKFSFFSEIPDFQLVKEPSIRKWIDKVLLDFNATAASINFIFCTDEHLLDINQKYLNHDYYTDIITFPYQQYPQPLEAEIYISIDRVKENARHLGVAFHDELLRVIIHGVLHLLGFDDHSTEDIARMREMEDQCLQLYKEQFDRD